MPSKSLDISNPAVEAILADYQRYHLVLVIVSSLLLLGVATLIVLCWRRLRAARRSAAGASRRQNWTLLAFIVGGILVALFLGLIDLANFSTVLDPAHGFAGVKMHSEGYSNWVASGSASIPAEVQRLVDARLSWQRPKAIIVTVLLITAVAASAWIWRKWITRAYASRLANAGLFASGLTFAAVSLLLMLMVMGNTQAAFAPIAMSLAFG